MIKNSEKGVSLILTFFVLVIVLAVVLSVSVILYSEIKIIRNIGDSVVAFYAADSGVEKVLYYDRKTAPEGIGRGFCGICDYEECISGTPSGADCAFDTCTDCEISFETDLNSAGSKSYEINAKISPEISDEGAEFSKLSIDSAGSYYSLLGASAVKRAVNLTMLSGEGASSAPKFTSAYVDPVFSELGYVVYIIATFSGTVGDVFVNLSGYNSEGEHFSIENLQIDYDGNENYYFVSFESEVPAVYTASITACNSEDPPKCSYKTINSATR